MVVYEVYFLCWAILILWHTICMYFHWLISYTYIKQKANNQWTKTDKPQNTSKFKSHTSVARRLMNTNGNSVKQFSVLQVAHSLAFNRRDPVELGWALVRYLMEVSVCVCLFPVEYVVELSCPVFGIKKSTNDRKGVIVFLCSLVNFVVDVCCWEYIPQGDRV